MTPTKIYRLDTSQWSTERIVFLIAGIFVILSVILGFIVHPGFYYATAFFGSMLVFFSLTGYCPMAILVDSIIQKHKR